MRRSSLWSVQDDQLLLFLKDNRNYGWKRISTYFRGRTSNACQFRWRRLKGTRFKTLECHETSLVAKPLSRIRRLDTHEPDVLQAQVNVSIGRYRDSEHHVSDSDSVLRRARLLNVDRILLTGSSYQESRWSIDEARRINAIGDLTQYPQLYTTVGVHPCTVLEFEPDPDNHLDKIRRLIKENLHDGTIRAFGEIGLDYDRLHHTPMDKQKQYFEMQLKLATEFNLPLFLHMRNALDDFLSILLPFIDGTREDGLALKNKNVLVHSFTGTEQDLERILQHPSFFISVNGCSLKTPDNCAVAAKIPLDRLLIETDAPWCEVRRTHSSYGNITKCPNEFYPFEYDIPQELLPKTIAKKGPKLALNEFLPIPLVKSDKLASFLQSEDSKKLVEPMVKSRNEPCLVGQIAEIMAKLRETEPQILIDSCYRNSLRWLDLS
ncbi:hypothetical protein KL930_004163 [Ogataea haglerorum]|uniref:Uncharacterized protein n=1 Tax=Ogataea haglerorum TaxID=1937702 RepID=A0AAN6DAY2_9ASCO|nr:uncharacterized protein KL911_001505 [Ogataea haglerorum]KAG7694360.1 hypothetical protein KL951_004238 [Ogataea haglerorum]KAG7712084.1 hypothetical protein KL914_000726 [Ogataea haglerorum]KAG7712856.1 hypothetical protein KL950_000727 [Ogataea haglerorum]KAG7722904.1 hypothetical protein KL913_000724 [Ogataea haglerorum]KAG7722997.1 hypothetical protein KL949_000047 [Ogataea haglerorum]